MKNLWLQIWNRQHRLGGEVVSDYSSGITRKGRKKVHFTDYRRAHTDTYLIDPDCISIEEYENIEDLETHRRNISHQITEEDAEQEYIKRIQKEDEERIRLERLETSDMRAYDLYNKTHALLLGIFKK